MLFSRGLDSIMGDDDGIQIDSISSDQQRSIIYKFLINYSIQVILNKYHASFCTKDTQQINTNYREYLNGINKFIESLMVRTSLTLTDFQKIVIMLHKFLNLTELHKLKLNITLKQVLLALLVKYKDSDEKATSLNWHAISGYSTQQLELLLNHVECVFDYVDVRNNDTFNNGNTYSVSNNNEDNDIMKINSHDLAKLNSMMKTLIYNNFEMVH